MDEQPSVLRQANVSESHVSTGCLRGEASRCLPWEGEAFSLPSLPIRRSVFRCSAVPGKRLVALSHSFPALGCASGEVSCSPLLCSVFLGIGRCSAMAPGHALRGDLGREGPKQRVSVVRSSGQRSSGRIFVLEVLGRQVCSRPV